MGQAYSVIRNEYLRNTKNQSIFTPPPVCNWLYHVLQPELGDVKTVLDPACGSGNLLAPFKDVIKIGADITDYKKPDDINFVQGDFLDWEKGDYPNIDLGLLNSPYNHSKESRAKWGKSSLLPELFVDQYFKLFGKDAKLVLFTPMGLRLNTRCYTTKQGERYKNIRDNWGEITSVVSLPLDTFHNPDFNTKYPVQNRLPHKFTKLFPGMKTSDPKVKADPIKYFLKSNLKRMETHQEILFFNMPNLKPHLMLPESVIEELRIGDKELWS